MSNSLDATLYNAEILSAVRQIRSLAYRNLTTAATPMGKALYEIVGICDQLAESSTHESLATRQKRRAAFFEHMTVLLDEHWCDNT